MKIKIIRDVPIEPKHGIELDDVMETIDPPEGSRKMRGEAWVNGHAGEPVRLFSHEYEVVKE